MKPWTEIDRVAESLGVKEWARKKWRARGIPPKWQVAIWRKSDGRLSLDTLENIGKPMRGRSAA